MSATDLAAPAAWTAELTADWTVGDRQSWTVTEDRSHPALGINRTALTETLRDADLLPEGWDDQLAEMYALAAHAYLSFEVGARAGMRGAWSARMRALAAVLMCRRTGLATPFAGFADVYEDFRGDNRWGWGDGTGGMRRLYERGLWTVSGFRQVDPDAGPTWRLRHPRDHQTLDRAWTLARTAGGDVATFIPLLACDAVGCFAPARRQVMLRASDGSQRPVDVPSLWELVAVALVIGPSGLVSRGERFVAQEAQRVARPRRDHKTADRPLSANTLEALRGNFNGTVKTMADIARRIPELRELWAEPPRLGKLDRSIVRRGRTTTRTAVPLTAYRRARAAQLDLLAKTRKTSRQQGSQTAAKEAKLYTTVLRHTLWLDLYGQISARPIEIAQTLLVKHFDAAHPFELDGTVDVRPAILLTPAKEVPIAPHWRPIHASTAELLEEWIEWMELGPRDWLFPHRDRASPWTAAQAGRAFTNLNVIPIAGRDHGYQLTRLRHLGEALAYTVGAGWLAANPSFTDRVSAKVLADAQLAHVMSEDRLGYRDLEEHRELWAYRAALGDQANGVPGVLGLLLGDAGARKGWDLHAVRQALRAAHAAISRRGEAEAAFGAAERHAKRARLRVEALFDRSRAPSALEASEARQQWEDQWRRAQHDYDLARDRLDDARRNAQDAKLGVTAAEQQLDAVRDAGRTWSLHDSTPLAHELPTGQTALDAETWEQVIERADGLRAAAHLHLHPAADDPTLLRIRHHLNLQELAGLCDVSDRTARNWVDQDTGRSLTQPGAGQAVVVISKRLRCVAVERLADAFLRRLTPSQHELLDQMLTMAPMGSTRWGGPAIDPERIAAMETHMGCAPGAHT